MTENKDYVSLHNHTTFSIMDSLIKPSDLFKRVKELGQSAVAVTDHGTLAGAWDCLKYSREAGVKLIMGCEFYFVDDLAASENQRMRHVILLAKNHQGYKNLLALNLRGFENAVYLFKKSIPRIDWKLLEQYSEGLICTTACGGGIISQLLNTRKLEEAKSTAKRLKDIFASNLALEIQPHSMRRIANIYKDYEDQKFTNHQLIKLGKELDIKVIAATDAHYLTPEQHETHDVMLAIGSGQPITSGNRLKYTPDFYLKTREEVRSFFSNYPDADEFCDNTLYFADLCETPDWIDPKYTNPSGKELPTFPVVDQPDFAIFKSWQSNQNNCIQGMADDVAYLRYWCDREFQNKFGALPEDQQSLYRSRLEEEFSVIEYHGFSSYMLIVSDYIEFCRKENIIVGPGRGSVGGSLIAYLTGIHQADPLKYKLIFARFLNKEKTEFPDIDTDFASSGRDRVLEYIYQKYGKDRVAHVSNIIEMKPKVYVRDIARVFQYGGDPKSAVAVGNALAESIPKEITSVETALAEAPLFQEYANSDKYHHLKKFAQDLGTKPKTWGTHAGGIVIGKRPLAEIVPMRIDKNGEILVEYEKTRAEANGLVKMDVLGVKTLDIIRDTYEIVKEVGKSASPPDYNTYDEKTYDLLGRGDTLCVFQLGTSGGTIELCRQIKPKSIEDISLINALARPSARDIRSDFIEVRNGTKPFQLLHPALERAFGGTYGFGLFEECLMYLAQDVSGWDLHKADRLRKLTKEKGKNPKKAAEWRKEFIDGAITQGFSEELANQIWDEVVDKFQGYGFNASHSIFYSLTSFHTAYLKAHFPLEFLTANLKAEVKSKAVDSADNIAKIKSEIRKMKIKILPPNINTSDITYKIIDSNTLMTGLDALKFIGKDAIPEILDKRPFASFEDFLSKVNGKKVKAPAVQALAASGCLDSFGMSRRQMFLYASDYKKKLAVFLKRKGDGKFEYPWPDDKEEWTTPQKYAMEVNYLGEGLSGNKIQVYPGFFNSLAPKFNDFRTIFPDPGDSDEHHPIPPIQAEVISFFEFKVKKETSKSFGKPMAKLVLEDPWGTQMPMTVFAKQWPIFKERVKTLTGGKTELVPGVVIHARGSLNWYNGDISITFEDLLKCAPPPAMPSDREPRKVSMRIGKVKKKAAEELTTLDILEEVEDELIEEGKSDDDEYSDLEFIEESPEDQGFFDVFND